MKRTTGADGKSYQVVRMYVTAKAFYEKVISDKKVKDRKNRRAEQVMSQGTKLTQNMAVTILLGAITVGLVPQRRNSVAGNIKTFLMNIAPVNGVRFECEKPSDDSFSPFRLESEKAERERAIEEEREREREEELSAEMGVGKGKRTKAGTGIGMGAGAGTDVGVDDEGGDDEGKNFEGNEEEKEEGDIDEAEMKIEDAMYDALGEDGEMTDGGDRDGSGTATCSGSGTETGNSEDLTLRRGSGSAKEVSLHCILPTNTARTHADSTSADCDATVDSDTVQSCLSDFDPVQVSAGFTANLAVMANLAVTVMFSFIFCYILNILAFIFSSFLSLFLSLPYFFLPLILAKMYFFYLFSAACSCCSINSFPTLFPFSSTPLSSPPSHNIV